MKAKYHIVIEGTIGVGKTSLAKLLADRLECRLILEQFEDNPFGQRIPLWLTGMVLGRDVIVVTGSALVYLAVGDLKVRPHFISKVSSVLQMVCIGWVLFKLSGEVTFWLAMGASVTTAITGLMYMMDGIRQFSEHPMAHPEREKEN